MNPHRDPVTMRDHSVTKSPRDPVTNPFRGGHAGHTSSGGLKRDPVTTSETPSRKRKPATRQAPSRPRLPEEAGSANGTDLRHCKSMEGQQP